MLDVFFYGMLGPVSTSSLRADLTVLNLFVSLVVWVAGRAGALLPRDWLLFRGSGVVLAPYCFCDHVHVGLGWVQKWRG